MACVRRALSLLCLVGAIVCELPTDDPVATFYGTAGVAPGSFDSSSFPWDNVVAAGSGDPAQAYADAAKAVLTNNPHGGVVYFKAGEYVFDGGLSLVDGVVLRGASTGAQKAIAKGGKPGALKPTTVFSFPDRMFSRISCSNCTRAGVVNIMSDGGGVVLSQGAIKSQSMFIVLSNEMKHVVYKFPVPPPATFYQEWPYRFSVAVDVTASQNVLIANNLLAKATKTAATKVTFEAGKTAQNCTMSVPFAYDNRYGIWHHNDGQTTVNVSIMDNFVSQNGRVGVQWQSQDRYGVSASAATPQGTGVAVIRNHVSVVRGTTVWSIEGSRLAHGSSTNENRGYDQSGSSALASNSGTLFADNTGNINRQFVPGTNCKPSSYETTDGEGMLQQIQDGQVAQRNIWRNNDFSMGSSGYMGLYALHAVQDMTIEGNKVISTEKIGIYGGGSTPKNGTGISNLVCKGNTPPAVCK